VFDFGSRKEGEIVVMIEGGKKNKGEKLTNCPKETKKNRKIGEKGKAGKAERRGKEKSKDGEIIIVAFFFSFQISNSGYYRPAFFSIESHIGGLKV
jgi:hypothetical protein